MYDKIVKAERIKTINSSSNSFGLLGLAMAISWMLYSWWPIVITLLFGTIGGIMAANNYDCYEIKS